MKKHDVITAMDVCADIILYGDVVPRFAQEEQILSSYEIMMGGSAPIFACQCAKLGLKTAGIGVVGKDSFGDMFLNALSGAGVSTEYVRVGDEKTGVTFALCQRDDRAMLTYPGTIEAVTPDAFSNEVLASARHLHIASYFLMPKLRDVYADVAKRARALGLTVSVDTNWDPACEWRGVKELLEHCDVFLPNEAEIMAITGKSDVESALKAARGLVPHVALKLGEKGAVYAGLMGEERQNAFKVDAVDAIGAGDSFDGGFVWAFLRGMGAADCLRAGCAAGSMSVRGAGGTASQARMDELVSLCRFAH